MFVSFVRSRSNGGQSMIVGESSVTGVHQNNNTFDRFLSQVQSVGNEKCLRVISETLFNEAAKHLLHLLVNVLENSIFVQNEG